MITILATFATQLIYNHFLEKGFPHNISKKMNKNIMHTCLLLLCSTFAFGQPQNPQQKKVALEFTESFLTKDFSNCWKLFDTTINPPLDSLAFLNTLTEIRDGIHFTSNDVEILMSGYKFINGNKSPFYSLKYVKDVSKPAGFLFDVMFMNDSTLLVVSFQPKGRMGATDNAASSKGKETKISGREAIKINRKKYQSRGVNIVHFAGNSGIVMVQIEQKMPENLQQEEMKIWATNEAIKFAKWLYKSDYYKTAIKDADKSQTKLLPQLGVSFINPETGVGYNTMVPKKDYK
jgi:hypothetical protein